MAAKYNLPKVFSVIAILALTFSNVQPARVEAQSGDGLTRQVNAESGRVSFITPVDGKPLSAVRALGQSIRPQDPAMALATKYAPEFGVKDPQRSLTAMDSNRADDGRLTVRFQQNYEDIPVMGGELIVNTNDNGDLYSISGEVSPKLSLSTQPAIDAGSAQQTALQAVAKWYQKTPEDFTATEPKLWIYDESLLQPSTRPVELVWRMEVTPKEGGMPVRELVLINAQRGSISQHFNQVDASWTASQPAQDGSTPTPEPTQPTETPVPVDMPVTVLTPVPTQENQTETVVPPVELEMSAPVTDAGQSWYVATGGNDSTNSCSIAASPCATINGALSKAGSGDTVKVAVGSYTGTGSEVVLINKTVTLSGGWDATFSSQTGVSTIDGQNTRRCVLVNNGVSASMERFTVQNGNAASDWSGGGIYITASTLTVNNSTIKANKAPGGAGGGIYSDQSSVLILNNSVISDNSGTGIYNYGSLTLNNSTVARNNAPGGAGIDNVGLDINGGIAVLNNSTVSGNIAGSYGGGLINDGSASLTLNNSTVSGNTAQNGGGIYKFGGTITLKNSIVASNSSTSSSPDCYGTINSAGYNLIGNTSGCTFSTSTGDQTNVNPQLGELIGFPGYHPLSSGSPAIDLANPAVPGSGGSACLSNDARGVTRPVGTRCDIGAYEYTVPGTAAALLVMTGDNQRTAPGVAFPLPLKAVAVDSQGSPVSNLSVTFTAPGSGASGTFSSSNTRTTTVSTNGNGIAVTSSFTANNNLGAYSVVASANAAGSVSFNLENLTWFVATTGSNSNSCKTPSAPCATINGAIGKAGAGDMIKVAQGNYRGAGTAPVVTVGNGITLSGGWNNAFSAQDGFSVIDGQNARSGVTSSGSTIDHFKILNGYAASGSSAGGVDSTGNLVLNYSVVMNNSGPNYTSAAGGIYAYFGSVTLNNSTVRNNYSPNDGGGIFINHSASLNLNNSTVTENEAGSSGGGIVLIAGISGSPQVVNINNSTIVNNRAASIGGIKGLSGGSPVYRTLNIRNSIIANNTSDAYGPDCWGTIDVLNNSLLGKSSDCTVASGSGNLINANPLIIPEPAGALGYHALQPGSPAINAGANCLAIDQRGVSRPQGGGCDMGAYEFTSPGSAAMFGLLSGSDQKAGTLLPFWNPLVIYVVDANGSPVGNVSVTFTAPESGPSGTFADSGTRSSTVLTNASGLAVSPTLMANSQSGAYTVSVSVSGLSGTVNFALTNASWFVAPTGSDTNSCTSSLSPCLTIEGAIAKADHGDAIKVAVGIYTRTATPNVVNINKNLTISGGWDPAFDAQIGQSIVDGGNTYSGFFIDGVGEAHVSHFIIRNSATGFITTDGGIFTIDKSALVNNGNAVSNRGKLTVVNSTISGSKDTALSNINGTATIKYSTVVHNGSYFAFSSGNGAAFVYVENSIFAWNSATSCSVNLKSIGHNIFKSSPPCIWLGSIPGHATDLVGVDPKLLPLMPNGVHPLNSQSPAINSAGPASCPAMDQRGVARPKGNGCDIGAFEYQGPGTVPAYILDYEGVVKSVVIGNTTQFKAMVVDAYGDPVPDIPVTFTAPVNGASGMFTDTHTITSTMSTDGSGIATSATFRANSKTGDYGVIATVNGVLTSATIRVKNTSQPVRTYTAYSNFNLPGSLQCDETKPGCTNGYDNHADSAHRYAMGTSRFYLDNFNRYGIDNANMPLISSVHYCKVNACPYDNAFWNGEQIAYGDKHGWPMADDVVAHELTHGVTQYESNLFYYYQSGAISESLSDLFGEYYDQTNGLGNDADSAKWLIGEDITSLGTLRSMSNPPAYGDPDKMTSTLYDRRQTYDPYWDNGGVHTNSGVNNKAAYLLVQGGAFNGRTVIALGWEKTAAIYYEANSNLLTSGADYSDLYYALQQACTNLIGQKGIVAGTCKEVKNAIDAVQMNAQPVANYNTDAPLCDNGVAPEIIFADDLEKGLGNWNFDNNIWTRWQYDSPYEQYAQSGQHILYGDDAPQEQGYFSDARAVLKPVYIPTNHYLWFAQAYEFEYDANGAYDGGVLEYSKDGGATWADASPLIEYNGYKGKISTSYNNPLKGRSAFVGSSHGYISTRLNLATLAGSTVKFRWRMGLDDSGTALGWWIDNLKIYNCGPGPSFVDVPYSHPYSKDIEILYANGLTGGCATNPPKFCPDQGMNRAAAAVFILRANFGSSYVSPVPIHIFKDDWTKGPWAETWAEGMRNTGLSAGCQANPPMYCPWAQIPREQAVIFALRMKYGTQYTPPAATGTVFADMTNPGYYATSWAEKAYKDGIIPNCGTTGGKPNFCPNVLVSRGLAAYMIVRAKSLTMP